MDDAMRKLTCLEGIVTHAGVAVVPAGCGGVVALNASVRVVPTASDSTCTNGGQRIDTGLDKDGNGVLDHSEVPSIAMVCNGVTGASVLMEKTDVTADPHCVAGQ